MAQGQSQMAPQMAANGGRIKYQGGELVEDASMVEETPTGMMAENVEEVQEEPTREQLEVLAMEIFQLRLEELDEEQLMVVYQAAMEQQPEAMAMQEEDIQFNPQMAAPQMAAYGGRIGFKKGTGRQDPMGGFAHQTSQEMREAAPDQFGGGMNISHGGNEGGQSGAITNYVKGEAKKVPNFLANLGVARKLNIPYLAAGAITSAIKDRFSKNKDDSAMAPVEEEDDLFASADTHLPYHGTGQYDYSGGMLNTPLNPDIVNYRATGAHGGRIGLANGGVLGSHIPGYTTPPGYNRFDYPSGGVRVRRAEGGIMNLGGMEKDYRQEGGFVPLGKEEKADDVPARLSKNEFVFTADAVRAAGGGDIDAGAEVMENVMNNLESGGQISEESQGGGGEEMISEEELIETPNGAQEMYDQQAMLQSRMA